jgi:hypothetical protein
MVSSWTEQQFRACGRFMRHARIHTMQVPRSPRRDDLGILAQIVPPSAGGLAPDCYLAGLGLILSQNAHW